MDFVRSSNGMSDWKFRRLKHEEKDNRLPVAHAAETCTNDIWTIYQVINWCNRIYGKAIR